MQHKYMKAILIVAVIGIIAGCTNPADDVTKATVGEAVPVAEPAATTETPEEPAATETKPAETPSETMPAPVTEEPAAVETPAEPAAGSAPLSLSLNENSVITFTGSKVTGEHSGGFVDFTGTINSPDGTIEKAQIVIEINMESMYSDNKTLTETLKGERFFEVDKFPASKFVSTGIEKSAEGYNVTGNLEMHGVNKSITFPATIDLKDGTLTAQAEFWIDRFEWNITDVGVQDDLIRNEVVIKFEIEAV